MCTNMTGTKTRTVDTTDTSVGTTNYAITSKNVDVVIVSRTNLLTTSLVA